MTDAGLRTKALELLDRELTRANGMNRTDSSFMFTMAFIDRLIDLVRTLPAPN